MAYPTTIDIFTVPVSGTTLTNNPSFDHAAFHNQLGSAVGTIEGLLGTNSGTLSFGSPSINNGRFNFLNDTAGTHVMVFDVVGAGVNYWAFNGNTTGNPVQAFANGADSNVGIQLETKGTSSLDLFGTTINITGGNVQNFGTFTISGMWDGWVGASETWTYASGTTFKVSADVSGKYQVGDTLKLTQGGTVEYFNVVALPAVAGGTTTLTILGDSGTPLANTAITANFYSHLPSPEGFPNIFSYAGSSTGWNANITNYGQYRLTGRVCNIVFDVSGTSNATSSAITAPVNATRDFFEVWAYATDNGSGLSSPGNVQIVSGTNTINIFKQTSNGSSWTNTGAKRIIGNLEYII